MCYLLLLPLLLFAAVAVCCCCCLLLLLFAAVAVCCCCCLLLLLFAAVAVADADAAVVVVVVVGFRAAGAMTMLVPLCANCCVCSNGNGVVDRDELAVYVQWASSADNADPLHRRISGLFLEHQSLERAFVKCVAGFRQGYPGDGCALSLKDFCPSFA